MDTIKQRLEDTVKTCLKCFDAWEKDMKNESLRMALGEAVHELRKVTSRVEIEMAISERNGKTQKPLPVPSHRDRRPQREDGGIENGKSSAESGTHDGDISTRGESKNAGVRRAMRRPRSEDTDAASVQQDKGEEG